MYERKRKRKSIRLKAFDYSKSGLYFVTICINNHKCLLGQIMDDQMVLNEAGKAVEEWWLRIPQKFEDVELDSTVVMPNHFHGVIVIVGADQCVCPNMKKVGEHTGSPLHHVIQWFKTMTTNEYIKGVKEKGWKPFEKRFWQRNYYEHIVRNERELLKIREYILNNPPKWSFDRENPESRKYMQDHDIYWQGVYNL